MHCYAPLFAAGWGELVVVLIFFMISALGQLLSAKNKPAAPKPPRRVPRQGPQGAGQGGAPAAGEERAEKLRGEVEDFLREMQGKPPRPKPKPTPKPVAVKVQPTPPPPPVVQPPGLRRDSVKDHVTRHISTAEIAAHTATLGKDVGFADERMEQHLHERFEHRLGSLERQLELPKQAADSRAKDIVDLLRTPEGMRQAVIASEILRRPEI